MHHRITTAFGFVDQSPEPHHFVLEHVLVSPDVLSKATERVHFAQVQEEA